MKEEWEGLEDSPRQKWGEMKTRHEKELAELQIANNKAVVKLIIEHMAERRGLLKGNQ